MLAVLVPLSLGATGDDEVCLLQLPRRQQSFLGKNGVDALTRRGDATSVEVVRVNAAARAARRAGSCTRGDPGDYLPCLAMMEPVDADLCQDRTTGLRLGPCLDAMWEAYTPAGTMTITYEPAASGETDETIKIKAESAAGWSTIATIDSCPPENGPCTQVFDVQMGNLVIDSSSGAADVDKHFLITSLMLT